MISYRTKALLLSSTAFTLGALTVRNLLESGGRWGYKLRKRLFTWSWVDLNFRIRTARMLPSGSWNRLQMAGFTEVELHDIFGRIRSAREWFHIWLETGLHAMYQAAHHEDDEHAQSWYLRASMAFHFAQLYGNLTPEERFRMRWLTREMFTRAIPGLPHKPHLLKARFAPHLEFEGYLMKPERKPYGLIILSNGLNFSKEEMYFYALRFLRAGFVTLCYDDPVPNNFEDVGPCLLRQDRIYDALMDEVIGIDPELSKLPVGIFGVSLGAWKALRMACYAPLIKACIAVSPFYQLHRYVDDLIPLVLEQFQTLYRVEIFDEKRARQFFEWLKMADLSPDLPRLTKPVFVLGAGKDTVIPGDEALAVYKALPGPKRLYYDPNGDHMLMNRLFELWPKYTHFFKQSLNPGR